MSGHSKWATIKHQKGAKDKARGKLFAKILRQVEVAAREGGGDPEANPTLRTMFQKARDASVPMDTIDRAIKRGTGELEGVTYESITYEGYATNGVAVYVETVYGLPGLGRLLIGAISGEAGFDLPVIVAVVMVIGTAIILLNLLVDAVHALVDPTIETRGSRRAQATGGVL